MADLTFLQFLSATLKYLVTKKVTLHSPIDKGYAWIVLAIAALHNVHVGVYVGQLGILMVEFVHYFNISASQASWISTCAMVTGPVTGKILFICVQ